MQKRIVFGAILIATLAAVLWGDWRLEQYANEASRRQYGQDWFSHLSHPLKGLPSAILMAIVSGAAFLELRRLAAHSGAQMLPVTGLLATVLLATVTYWRPPLSHSIRFVFLLSPIDIFSLFLGMLFAEQILRRRTQDAFRDMAATVLAVAYLGACGTTILWVRMGWGVPALVLFLVACKFTDIGAYFAGSFFGRHKLIPWLSPGKTWEGLFGGVLAGAATCMAIAALTGWYAGEGSFAAPAGVRLAAWQGAVFGAVVGLAGQFADLCESLLKRSANLKDSGSLVPEFGGILDMIDSLLLSAPVAALLLAVMSV